MSGGTSWSMLTDAVAEHGAVVFTRDCLPFLRVPDSAFTSAAARDDVVAFARTRSCRRATP